MKFKGIEVELVVGSDRLISFVGFQVVRGQRPRMVIQSTADETMQNVLARIEEFCSIYRIDLDTGESHEHAVSKIWP